MSRLWTDSEARAALKEIFASAVAAADPKAAVLHNLPSKPKGRCVVVGAGKAALPMAAAVDAAWPDVDLSGVVVAPSGSARPSGRIEILEAAHPVPDARSEVAARRILASVQGLNSDDLVLALMSGGGSSLMALPAGSMSLADKQAVNRTLLSSGATIVEMNAVRKHLSAIKGGRLAAAALPARMVTLVVSDIPGDDPSSIASGPTLPDTSTIADVREIVSRYALDLPDAAMALIGAGAETPKPGDLEGDVRLIVTPSRALAAAAEAARRAGATPVILGDAIEGESREVGKVMAAIAKSVRLHQQPVPPPAVLLSGGETTVTIGKQPPGRGGRNTEFLLSFAIAINAEAGVWAVAGDSDGIDGTEDAAGAIAAPDTLARGHSVGLSARQYLEAHDSYTFFERIGDLVLTGPTHTNVNDIRAVLIA